MSNLEASLDSNIAPSIAPSIAPNIDPNAELNALADQRILKHIGYVVLGMMGIAIAIGVTASIVA